MTLFGLGMIHLGLLLLLAVVSALETAIHSVRVLEGAAASPPEGLRETGLERRLRKIRENPFGQLQQALLLSAALNLALATLVLIMATGPIQEMGWNPWVSAPVLFAVTVLVGDVLPKFYAADRADAVLVGASWFLNPVQRLLSPLAKGADGIVEFLLKRIVPAGVRGAGTMTRDEFETLVEMRAEQGVISEDEASMIREVLDLETLIVRDAIVPRVDLPMMSAGGSNEVSELVLEQAAGRFVVVHGETPDSVEGVIDTLTWKLDGRPAWQTLMNPPVFVPETMPLLDALQKHLTDSTHAVLVVDEYGGLEGMVSQEEIADWLLHEAAPWLGEDAEVRDLGNGRYLLDGGARLDHFCEVIGIPLLPEESEGIDTIGGLVFKIAGRVPKAGERFDLGDVQAKIRRMTKARIKQLEIRVPSRILATASDEGGGR